MGSIVTILGGQAFMLTAAGILGKIFIESRLKVISETRVSRAQEIVRRQSEIVHTLSAQLDSLAAGAQTAMIHNSVGLKAGMKETEAKRMMAIVHDLGLYFDSNRIWLGSDLDEHVQYAISLMTRALDRYYGSGHLDRVDEALHGEKSDVELHNEMREVKKQLMQEFRTLLTIDAPGNESEIRFSKRRNWPKRAR